MSTTTLTSTDHPSVSVCLNDLWDYSDESNRRLDYLLLRRLWMGESGRKRLTPEGQLTLLNWFLQLNEVEISTAISGEARDGHNKSKLIL